MGVIKRVEKNEKAVQVIANILEEHAARLKELEDRVKANENKGVAH